jgi:tRNA 2-selenouridine synthase
MGSLSAPDFVLAAGQGVLFDVRSPAEYDAGHIPGAVSMPLFNNEERAVVGTLFKEQGQLAAIEAGLGFVGPKMAGFVRQAREAVGPGGAVTVYCWRGGMRSGSVRWLLEQAGFQVSTLANGYKGYRTYVRQILDTPWLLHLVGGYTGSGKTELLQLLANAGEQVIDLEALANHKGSAFGGIGLAAQPRIEMFENLLVTKLLGFDASKAIWLEDESQNMGKVFIYSGFFKQMRAADVCFLEVDMDTRVPRLVHEYASLPKEELAAAFKRIRKRMGGQRVKEALENLQINDFEGAARVALEYYDKSYRPTGTITSRVKLSGSDLESVVPTFVEIAKTKRALI